METRILAIFAKDPRAGTVKTRLAESTSPGWAASVAAAFLSDTIQRLNRLADQRFVVISPPDAVAYFGSLAGEQFSIIPQGDGDLGQRLQRFFQPQLHNDSKVVVVGSDSPTLPVTYVEQAFAALSEADMVLGPATDGGYYLLGLARRLPPIFHGIDWGSEHVLEQTVSRLDSDCRLALLPPWYDVDTLADWHMFRGHVLAMRRAGLDPGIPHTETLLCSRDALAERS